MRRQFAEDAEVVHGADDAATEQMMPDAVDIDPRDERCHGRVGHLLGEFEPAAAGLDVEFIWSCKRLKEAAWHDRPERLWIAAREYVFIDAVAVLHGRGNARFKFELTNEFLLRFKHGSGDLGQGLCLVAVGEKE